MVKIAGVVGADRAPGLAAELERVVATGARAVDRLVGLRPAAGAVLGAVTHASRSGERRTAQPVALAGGSMVVADARLDNREWLRKTLGDAGRQQAEDAELIALAYQRWGVEVAHRLEGDFAFLVWDAATRTLTAARDGLGVRPLFYAEHDGRLWLASEVEQLLHVPGVSTDLCDGAVLDFLTGEARETECSMFSSIRRVQPGHSLIFRAGVARQSRYWQPRDELSNRPPQDAHAAFAAALDEAVRSRLESDHPVMIYMSGGLDSSGIACLADRQCRSGAGPNVRVVAASAVYPGLSCDESEAVQTLSAGFRAIEHTTWEGMDSDSANIDSPAADWPGSRVIFAGGSARDLDIARQIDARVFLSGEGGDEVCWDGGVAAELIRSGRILTAVRETLLLQNHPLRWRLSRLRTGFSSLAPARLSRAMRRGRRPLPPDWLASRLGQLWSERQSAREMAVAPTTAAEAVVDLIGSPKLAMAIERSQRYASGVGAEVRFPYLDRRVIRVSASLSLEQRRPQGRMRGFQRRALKGLVPESVLARRIVFLDEARAREAARLLPGLHAMLAKGEWLSERFVARDAVLGFIQQIEANASDRVDGRAWNAVRKFGSLEAWLRRRQELAARP